MTSLNREENHPMNVTRQAKFVGKVHAQLPAGQSGVYGLGRCWQLSPTEIGVVANIRSWGSDVVDLELGNDMLILDRLDAEAPRAVFPLNRTEEWTDPEKGGSQLVAKYPLCGDFVPLGALRADGSPHPHAGTGFGICSLRGFPLDATGQVSVRYLGDLESIPLVLFELQQYRYDGKQFIIEHSELVAPDGVLEGCLLVNPPIGNGIHDGDDILTGLTCRTVGTTAAAPEVSDRDNRLPHLGRWRRTEGRWQLADVQPVSDEAGFFESSVVRDSNGDLLYTARDCGQHKEAVFTVWRSTDNGVTWQKILREVGKRAHAPVSINRALDGTIYLASCAARGGVYHVNFRDSLDLWPLSADRGHTLPPITARDCPGEFGAPSHSQWRVDHPISTSVRLSDQKWRHLLCYRIMEEHGAPPTETTGLYLEEVQSGKLPETPWVFGETSESPAG